MAIIVICLKCPLEPMVLILLMSQNIGVVTDKFSSLNKLKDFYRQRLQVPMEAGPDILTFESIPNKLEAQAYVELLEEENVQIPSSICFSSVDGENVVSGESFKKVAIVGINCVPPHFVRCLIQKFKKLDSGEIWDGITKRWLPSKWFDDDKFELFASR